MARARINAEPMTPAERVRASRAARRTRTVELAADVLDLAERVCQRDGDATVTAAIARAVRLLATA